MLAETVTHTSIIDRYYQCFNERRFQDAAALFADDAQIEFSPGTPWCGPAGYVQFGETWTTRSRRDVRHRVGELAQ